MGGGVGTWHRPQREEEKIGGSGDDEDDHVRRTTGRRGGIPGHGSHPVLTGLQREARGSRRSLRLDADEAGIGRQRGP